MNCAPSPCSHPWGSVAPSSSPLQPALEAPVLPPPSYEVLLASGRSCRSRGDTPVAFPASSAPGRVCAVKTSLKTASYPRLSNSALEEVTDRASLRCYVQQGRRGEGAHSAGAPVLPQSRGSILSGRPTPGHSPPCGLACWGSCPPTHPLFQAILATARPCWLPRPSLPHKRLIAPIARRELSRAQPGYQ